MKKPLFLTAVLFLILQMTTFAQSIKMNNAEDPGSAMLEVSSSSKGILIPNVSLTGTTDATTIASPATSLLVYNTATVSNIIPGYYYNSGTPGLPVWSKLSTANEIQNLTEVLAENNDAGTLSIINLGDPTNPHDAVTKAYVDILKIELEELRGVKDIDNNRYEIITIGTQTWMAENLKTTRYNDGTVIPLIIDSGEWQSATYGAAAYSFYDNDFTSVYGGLYNWYALSATSNGGKNICPMGWHVPTDSEWIILSTYLGGYLVAGGKMKEAGFAHWILLNSGGSNESGFSGLPGGIRDLNGIFGQIGLGGYWRSSTENDATSAWYCNITYHDSHVYRSALHKGHGFSVRCLRD